MGILPGDALRVVADPDVDYVQDASHGPGQRLAKRGPISVAYSEPEQVIITVLWNTTEQYSRKEKT